MQLKEQWILGLYSDTSVQEIEVALVLTDGLDILKVDNSFARPYPYELKDKLFDLFKNISCKNFSNNWKAYILIKDLQLSESQVLWLLENSDNNLVLNRILRYPFYNKQIAVWCNEQLNSNSISNNRYSEYISQTLEILDDFYSLCNQNKYKIETLAYSIKYSHFSKKDKESALTKLLCFDNKNLTISKLAYELELYSIIKKQI